MRVTVVILVCAVGTTAFGSDEGKVSLGEVAESAVQQSKLVLPGSTPFHLKAEIVESTNPSSEYQAKVEESWVSPEKWRRTIESPGFSQILIVNGDQISETDTGGYLPWWLNDLVTAMVDPLPMVEMLTQMNAQMPKPRGTQNSNTCADLCSIKAGVFCFEGTHGLLTSANTRGYYAEFQDFRGFADKRVARLILIDPEPGTTIQARIMELTEFQGDEATLFAVPKATPPGDRVKSIKVDEGTIRHLASPGSDVTWPPVESGPTTGTCAVYVSADRTGHIREVWPAGCDNAGLQDPLRDMVKKWQLKQATENGMPVQIEGLLNFTFDAKLVSDHPVAKVPDPGAQSLPTKNAESHPPLKEPPVVPPHVVKVVKPDCSSGQSCHGIHGDVVVVVDVLADGTVGDVTARSGDPRLFDDATKAAKQCIFQAGTLVGKPTSMNFDLKYQF
jgi:hypothetical protein